MHAVVPMQQRKPSGPSLYTEYHSSNIHQHHISWARVRSQDLRPCVYSRTMEQRSWECQPAYIKQDIATIITATITATCYSWMLMILDGQAAGVPVIYETNTNTHEKYMYEYSTSFHSP